ncbi:DEKNAAC104924 [Brettanomyces naardenensis]|uniref:DNA-binding protein RAP1 n=1 Tax=Brettanomyces naardenensis TaxID=13370 RepID=A0A448YS92_BRENA|nr:DEKNAAC104924 [Brettanomyces naardenensis]
MSLQNKGSIEAKAIEVDLEKLQHDASIPLPETSTDASLDNSSSVAAAALAAAAETEDSVTGGGDAGNSGVVGGGKGENETGNGEGPKESSKEGGAEEGGVLADLRSNSSSLLRGRRFVVYGQTTAADDVKQMVISLGGEVVPEGTPGSVALVRSASSAIPVGPPEVFSFDLIYYVHSRGVIPEFDSFKIRKPPSLPANLKINASELAQKTPADIAGAAGTESTNPITTKKEKAGRDRKIRSKDAAKGETVSSVFFPTPKKRSAKFTESEDAAILDLIRRNPYLRSTHSFYAQIAQLPMLSNHTGNSIRFRFRKVLSKRLDWVYKVDPETNEIQLNPETQEPLKLEELPGLLKSQYTAEDDYNLCKCVLDFRTNGGTALRKRKMDSKSIPESIFQELSIKYPRHSAMSWRDRYRKFASVYGLERYIGEFEKCIADKTAPEPMRNLSSRGANKRRKVAHEGEEGLAQVPDPRNGDAENQNEAHEQQDLGAARIQALARVSVERKETEDSKDEEEDDEEKKTDGQSANLFEDADEMKALNIDFTGSINPHGNLMGNLTVEALKKSEPEPMKNRSDANVDEIIKDIEDLFGEFGSDITSSEELFKAVHEKTGLSTAWLNYWFDCSCGMFNVFLDAVQNYLKTGELTMQNHQGFWTKEHDQMLNDESKLPELYKLHGEESVNKRRATIMGERGE